MSLYSRLRRGMAARLMFGTLVSQALLSGGSFLVAFVLLRRLGDEQYGYYILATVTLLLLTSLQGAFFGPPIVVALSSMEAPKRHLFLGGLVRVRQRLLWLAALGLFAGNAVAWVSGLLSTPTAMLICVGDLVAIALLYREFYRGILLASHQVTAVLLSDVVYVALLIASAFAATYLPHPALFAVAGMGLGAACGGLLAARAAWRFEAWDLQGSPTALREISSQGAWSVFGAAVHWTFSQGYTYVVAALLDVRAVAALAATRLLMMPINLLSSGINQSVFPLVSRWNQEMDARLVLRRTLQICLLLVLLSSFYGLLVWALRDWFFDTLLHKNFADRDLLLLCWAAVFIVMTLRDQIGCLLMVRSRLRELSQFTFVSAVLALLAIRLAVPELGPVGALVGILLGELFNLMGLLILSFAEIRQQERRLSKVGAT